MTQASSQEVPDHSIRSASFHICVLWGGQGECNKLDGLHFKKLLLIGLFAVRFLRGATWCPVGVSTSSGVKGFAAGTSIHLLVLKMRNGLSVKESEPLDPSISSP